MVRSSQRRNIRLNKPYEGITWEHARLENISKFWYNGILSVALDMSDWKVKKIANMMINKQTHDAGDSWSLVQDSKLQNNQTV